MIDKRFREIYIYFDCEHNLIAIPMANGQEVDIVCTLNPIYSTDVLETFILKTLGKCFLKKPRKTMSKSGRRTLLDYLGIKTWKSVMKDRWAVSNNERCTLTDYLGVKTWKSAMKGRGAVRVLWVKGEGFSFIPTRKAPKMNYALSFITAQEIFIPESYIPGQLAEAFLKAMAISEEAGI